MLVNIILSTFVLLLQEIRTLESASTTHRIVYQTFFDNLLTNCYGKCTLSPTEYTGVTSNVRCEGNNVRLKCEANHVIRVSYAFYGELEPGQELCKDASTVLEQCRKDVLNIVSKDCNGRDFCLFTIDNDRFGKFCQAKYFYLDIRHLCEFRPSTMANNHFPTTTSSAVTTRVKTTTEKSTKLKPITIFNEKTSKSTNIRTRDFEGESTSPIYTTKGRRPDVKETKSSQSPSSTSQSSSSTTSSSSPVTTHVPVSSPGTSVKRTTPGKNSPALNIDTSSATNGGRQAANSTHLALAVILSIFIALVLSVCFILDHCRREKRRQALIKSRESEAEEGRMENGSPMAFDLRRGPGRPKNGSRCNSAVANGSVKRSMSHSLEDLNHNSEEKDDRLPLIPIAAPKLREVTPDEFKESAFITRSSTIDLLPPPPEELLADTPQFDKSGFLDDDDSETSTLSIPPPVGFGDFDVKDSILNPANVQPVVKVTSPTPTNSSVSSSHVGVANCGTILRSVPKIENSKRLNNEFFPEGPPSSHDSNLLQNSVSVQTNDLRDGYDRQSKVENPGLVSMRSPHFEATDVYATTDKVSNVGYINLHEISAHDSEHIKSRQRKKNERSIIGSITSPKAEAIGAHIESNAQRNEPSQKRGRLLVIKSPGESERKTDKYVDRAAEKLDRGRAEHETDSKSVGDVLLESGKSVLRRKSSADVADIPNGNLKQRRKEDFERQRRYSSNFSGKADVTRDGKSDLRGDSRADTMSETSSCASNVDSESTAVLPRYDADNKQIFAVPKHRCGMGHKHPCVCIPLRTGSSSFICACLESAKQKSSKCCKENCTDDNSGAPYSSQRHLSGRGLATDTLKRKTYNGNLKRVSSLENLSTDKKIPKPGTTSVAKSLKSKEGGPGISFDLSNTQGTSQDHRSKTLPILQSKLKQKANGDGVKTLNRSFDKDLARRNEPKMIPVIVHSSSIMRGNGKPRFEKNMEKLEGKSAPSRSGLSRSVRSEDSDSSERSDSIDGHLSKSLPSTPTSSRRNKHGRLSPICETTGRKAVDNQTDTKSWPKRSPRFRIQVVESIHYDKRQRSNEV
ncbi:serine-rich adhesin for platelets-like isoform X2 [Rhopilema esculentum]|uniref:serine-rich adhesin for platelets-like isoform X2 n=1 Tax=Rhopilema esculentum TaxID=499914 RepID=UPI0031CFC018